MNIEKLLGQEYDGRPCRSGRNTDFSNLKFDKLSKDFTLWKPNYKSYNYYFDDWSSSLLKPDKSYKKAKIKSPIGGDYSINDPASVFDSCMYSPASLTDKNPKTAWAEGVDGDGIGEKVFVHLDISKKLKIWSGFGRSDELFLANNRPKDLKVDIFLSEDCQAAQDSVNFSGLIYTDSFNIVLTDTNSYQEFIIPNEILNKYNNLKKLKKLDDVCENGPHRSFLLLNIISVYKGSKYNDTLISELGYQ